MRANLTCPGCGLILTKAQGFIHNGETYCCADCAIGSTCMCAKPVAVIAQDQQVRRQRLAESREFVMRPRIR